MLPIDGQPYRFSQIMTALFGLWAVIKKTAGIASLFFGGDYEVILPAIVQLD